MAIQCAACNGSQTKYLCNIFRDAGKILLKVVPASIKTHATPAKIEDKVLLVSGQFMHN
jgi:hypothetical protein